MYKRTWPEPVIRRWLHPYHKDWLEKHGYQVWKEADGSWSGQTPEWKDVEYEAERHHHHTYAAEEGVLT